MATVFISHANKDDALTGDLLHWLHRNGFRDTFVDHLDILGGENWTDRLRDQAAACRVVICVLTDPWLASSECFNEFQAAWYMGKSILPVFLIDPGQPGEGEAARRLARVLAETQGIDLRGAMGPGGRLDLDRDHTTADLLARSLRAFGAQSQIGLDPTAFAIDPAAQPTPFPGLISFGDSDADAAIFYGRSREIAEAIEELRSMRANADRRPLVILGVSGAGKSSVLKAGILPRLRREPQAWLPLRVFRPGIDPLGSFAAAISRSFADLGVTEPPGPIRAALARALTAADGQPPDAASPVSAALDDLADRLRRAAGAGGATILISVDQAEELLRAADTDEARLGPFLAAALAGRRGWLVAFTIRTDRFPDLQGHPGFRDLKARGYDLRQLPPFRFSDVIEGPAARYGVKLSPDLVDAFMEDAPERDALPLLAFALQRLWDQFSASKELRLEDYQSLGGMSGLISDAAERALAGLDPGEDQMRQPSDGKQQARLRLAEHCFVPALVDVNDGGAVTRRTANWAEFEPDEQELLLQFEAWRLVVRRGVGAEATVEVAHEALFREWPRMRAWLEPEIHRIEVLRGLTDAARLWDQSGRKSVLLNHRGPRLTDARALVTQPRYAERLSATDRAYLAGCAGLRRSRALLYGAAAGLVVAAVGLGAWSYLQSERRMIAEREAAFAERVETAQGATDISTLESFTQYILGDPYARQRDDRFAVLRDILESANTVAGPNYAIAEYALNAVDVPDDLVFTLEYSAERGVDPQVFPVLWRPQATALARQTGLPAPLHFNLVENPDFPPGRVVIRRAGEVVFDDVLPLTDPRHMLDTGALDRADLRTLFAANKAAFVSAEPVTGSADHYYVPDWSVPVWNAGRDRNADSRVMPPGTDFTIALGNLIAEQPLIVLDDLALAQILERMPDRYGITVEEYREIRGQNARADVLAWLADGQSLGDLVFGLGAMAAAQGDPALTLHGPTEATETAMSAVDTLLPPPSFSEPQDKNSVVKQAAEPAPDTTLALRIAALEASLRHLDLRSRPIRVFVPPPARDPDDWHALHKALYRDETLALSATFLDAKAALETDLFRRLGVIALDLEIVPDPRLDHGRIAIETLTDRWQTPIDVTAVEAPQIAQAVLDAVAARIEAAPEKFVFPHDVPAYLEAASPGRRIWALASFAHTDLMQLAAGLMRAERDRPDRTGHSALVQFDWLLGALVFSASVNAPADGAAHLALWRDLSNGNAPRPETPDPAVAARVADGVDLLIADDVAGARAAFAEAAAIDPAAARAVFLDLYASTAPRLLFARIRSECQNPTDPALGLVEARQLGLLLGTLGAQMGDAITDRDRQHFELCLLGAQKKSAPETWVPAALAFAARLDSPDALDPFHAGWLGRGLWDLHDPLADSDAQLAVGRRFMLSAVDRIDDAATLQTVSQQLSGDCYARRDIRPCMRRVLEMAEASGKPALGLGTIEILASSIYPEDRHRAMALLDLFQASYGLEPDFAPAGHETWYRAYIALLRGVALFTGGAPGSPDWARARAYMTEAMQRGEFRFIALPILSKLITSLDGIEAAEHLANRALLELPFSNANAMEKANLYSLRFSIAVEAGHGEAFLDEMIALPEATGCVGRFVNECIATWVWRAASQVIYRHADWQTVARSVAARVDHPYSTLISLILNAQGGTVAGAPALLQRKWDQVDPALWPRRIAIEDEAVWSEILLSYAVGEAVDGYRPEDMRAILQDPQAFADHALSGIGLRREEMLTEALFYNAMLEIARGRTQAGIALLRQTRDVGYWMALEYAFARPLLDQLEASGAAD